MEKIWRASWLFAGCSVEALAAGDFFRFDLGMHSLLVVRCDDGAVRAVHNSCRHRGMPVCLQRAGHVKRLRGP